MTNRIRSQTLLCVATGGLAVLMMSALSGLTGTVVAEDDVIHLGGRRELLVDDFLIAEHQGTRLQIHRPVRREIAIVHDQPWEGNAGGYHAIFHDPDSPRGPLYRMYYHAWHIPADGNQGVPITIGYAESDDGIHWDKPTLGLVEFRGSTQNNIVLGEINGHPCHDFSVFRDTTPGVADAARYKAVGFGRNPGGLYAFHSADGIHWSLLNDGQPVMTGHPFDTQNVVFRDPNVGMYRVYIRDFDKGRRIILTSTSHDLIHWSPREELVYPGSPPQQLYTNQINVYHRAPHMYVGFPARYVDRGWTVATERLPEPAARRQRSNTSSRYGSAVTDGLLMTSRDGVTFRRWDEAFLRPGLRTKHNWSYGDNYPAWHLVETDSAEDDSPRELSLYATEGYFVGNSSRLRRYTLRMDGFVSVNAPYSGGEFTTRPLTFQGDQLSLNVATSAGGQVSVELQRPDGQAFPGYTLDDCDVIFGDHLDYRVTWRGSQQLTIPENQPVRLRFHVQDADIYSLQFVSSSSSTAADSIPQRPASQQ